MLNRDNVVGFLMLGFCAVVAGIMIYFIATGERPSINFGPVGNAIGFGIFIVLMIFIFLNSPLGRRVRGRFGRRETSDTFPTVDPDSNRDRRDW